MNRARGWCFTLNLDDDVRPTELHIRRFFELVGAGYLVCQKEVGAVGGTEHLQGYFYGTNRKSLGQCRDACFNSFGKHAHFEVARGSATENRAYCTKPDTAVPGTVVELGVIPRQGVRSDLVAIAADIQSGSSMAEIAENYPSDFIRYHRGIQEFATTLSCRHRTGTTDPEIMWWFGPTGTGKSRECFALYPTAYVKMNNKWWDGYRGEETVIIDDYRPDMCPFSHLLRILDRYPMRVETKGGSAPLTATRFIITTTGRPEVLWATRTEEDLGQLLRRLSSIVEFLPNGERRVLKDAQTPYQRTHPPAIAPGFLLPPAPVV